MPSSHSTLKFALNNLPLHKSNSNHTFAANTLQKSDSKECEQSEQLSPISTIFDTKSNNHHRFSKLGAKPKISSMNTEHPKNTRFLPKILLQSSIPIITL